MYEAIDRYVFSLIERSSPERTAWNIEKVRQGKPTNWNYIDGCMITALLAMAEISGDQRYFDFSRSFIDAFIGDDGAVRTFNPGKHTLDDINEGRVLFTLYERTGDQRYRLAADGIYMAMPFLALYEGHVGSGDYSDILHQIKTVRDHMRDSATGLYYHGYDASRSAFWADPETGLSKSFWLRSIGWFAVALADLVELLPEGDGQDSLKGILSELMESVWRFHDPETGMYYQVPDRPGEAGNYLESSGSAMLAYAMLKGARLGALDASYADLGQKTFNGIVQNKLSFEGGELNLGGICLVAGLGPEDNRRRDGTYAYYISEPVVQNDAKGVAPFVLCYTEVKRRLGA